jgi:CelD/BcsL family acetyltransferase involved in cellulose biosynthesis
MYSISRTTGAQAVVEIADEWDVLVDNSEAAIYSCPSWYLAWIDAFSPKEICVISLRYGGRLVGVLPLARVRTDERGLFFRIVAPIARGDYQPLIIGPQVSSEGLASLLDAARAHFGDMVDYWWPNIPAGAPCLAGLKSYLVSRGMDFVEEHETAPRLRFQGESYVDAERLWSNTHRSDVRRKRRRLASRGPVSLWQPSTLAEAEATLEQLFAVHDQKWLAQGIPGKFRDVRERMHYRAVLNRMSRGLHFSTLRCGTTDVSYHFGFLAGGWLQWYKPTYRLEFSEYSPGTVHLAMLIEQGYQSKWKGIDFLLGTERYKAHWSNESIDVVSIHSASHCWIPSYAWFSRGKPLVKKYGQARYVRIKAWLQKRMSR